MDWDGLATRGGSLRILYDLDGRPGMLRGDEGLARAEYSKEDCEGVSLGDLQDRRLRAPGPEWRGTERCSCRSVSGLCAREGAADCLRRWTNRHC